MVSFGVSYDFNAAQFHWSPEDFLQITVRAEKAGFEYVAVMDHMNMFPSEFKMFNAIVLQTAIALSTEKIRIGTMVSDPHRIHPAVMTQILLSQDRISKGRMFLGFGAGEAMNIEPYGIPWNKPVSRLEEAIQVIKRLSQATAKKPLTFHGQFFHLEDAFLQLRPTQRPHPPIWIAGNGPRTRTLTGQLADGWIPQHLDPDTYSKHYKEVKDFAKLVGRNPDEINPAYELVVGLSKDRELARRAILDVGRTTFIWGRQELIKKFGYKIAIPEEVLCKLDAAHMTVLDYERQAKLIRKIIQAIPEEAAEKINVYGTPDDVIQQTEQYVKAGCRTFITCLMGPDHEESFRLFARKVIPYFNERTHR